MRLAGNEPVANVLAVINRPEEYLGAPGRLVARSVAVRVDREWYNHVTVIRFGLRDGTLKDRKVIMLADVLLLETQLDTDREISAQEFQNLATAWRDAVGAADSPGFQDQSSVQRTFSDRRQPGRWPRWECRLHERTSGAPPLQSTDPYLDVGRQLFAHDLASLTGKWLQLPYWDDQNNLMSEYRLLIEDRRGRLNRLAQSDEGLMVYVEG
jgi:hypothetical protein